MEKGNSTARTPNQEEKQTKKQNAESNNAAKLDMKTTACRAKNNKIALLHQTLPFCISEDGTSMCLSWCQKKFPNIAAPVACRRNSLFQISQTLCIPRAEPAVHDSPLNISVARGMSTTEVHTHTHTHTCGDCTALCHCYYHTVRISMTLNASLSFDGSFALA